MDLHVGDMGFIFCGKHPLLITRIQVIDLGPKGPSFSISVCMCVCVCVCVCVCLFISTVQE